MRKLRDIAKDMREHLHELAPEAKLPQESEDRLRQLIAEFDVWDAEQAKRKSRLEKKSS